MLAIAQTNNNEALEYLKDNMTVGSSLLFVVASLFILCLMIFLTKSFSQQQTDHEASNKGTGQISPTCTDAKKRRIRIFGTAFILLLALVISSVLVIKASKNIITKP
ncbi:hypothetical protein, partial [uncultured Parasutterella sp.]